MQLGLRTLLDKHGITQRELATAIGKSDAAVSRLLSGETTASQETIDAVLAFLSKRLGRRVTYERAFGSAEVSA